MPQPQDPHKKAPPDYAKISDGIDVLGIERIGIFR